MEKHGARRCELCDPGELCGYCMVDVINQKLINQKQTPQCCVCHCPMGPGTPHPIGDEFPEERVCDPCAASRTGGPPRTSREPGLIQGEDAFERKGP